MCPDLLLVAEVAALGDARVMLRQRIRDSPRQRAPQANKPRDHPSALARPSGRRRAIAPARIGVARMQQRAGGSVRPARHRASN
jgi:hypothetical protein